MTTENTNTQESEISPAQALNNLYLASRLAPMTSNDHEILKSSAEVLRDFIAKDAESLSD